MALRHADAWCDRTGRATTSALVELIDVVPTILELCQVDIPANVQGKSLVPLLRGEVERHRDHVMAEYADNAEAMVRTERWKLVYSAGNRRRQDGYALDTVAPGKSIRLYDLEDDPGELQGRGGDDRERRRDRRLARPARRSHAEDRPRGRSGPTDRRYPCPTLILPAAGAVRVDIQALPTESRFRR